MFARYRAQTTLLVGEMVRRRATQSWKRIVARAGRFGPVTAIRPSPAGHLLVVLSNPPTTSGNRTLQRVEVAKVVLGHSTVAVANLFSIPTYRTGGISDAGKTPAGWLSARVLLANAVAVADAVVLAYGCQEPSGIARQHFRDQLAWLQIALESRALPTWMIDGRPRHPSRWHRHTFAQHPDLPFADALPLVLRPAALAN